MTDLPADMVEAAARALYVHQDLLRQADWFYLDESQRAVWVNRAKVALAAALATGEVREAWRVVGEYWAATFGDWGPIALDVVERRKLAEIQLHDRRDDQRRYRNLRIQHRIVHSLPSGHVLTSPWEEVSD